MSTLRKYEVIGTAPDGSKVFGIFSGLKHPENGAALIENVTNIDAQGNITKHDYLWFPMDRITFIREITITTNV